MLGHLDIALETKATVAALKGSFKGSFKASFKGPLRGPLRGPLGARDWDSGFKFRV